MTRYLVLLRGINVGGKNKVPMAPLRELLEELGYSKVATYIASGNVILSSDSSPGAIRRQIEAALPKAFRLDSDLIAALVLSRAQLRAVVKRKPGDFGEHPEAYHSDAIFLLGIDAATAMEVFDPHLALMATLPVVGRGKGRETFELTVAQASLLISAQRRGTAGTSRSFESRSSLPFQTSCGSRLRADFLRHRVLRAHLCHRRRHPRQSGQSGMRPGLSSA